MVDILDENSYLERIAIALENKSGGGSDEESGGDSSSGGSNEYMIYAGENVFMDGDIHGDEGLPPLTYEEMCALWNEHNGRILVSSMPTSTIVPLKRTGTDSHSWFEIDAYFIGTNGGLNDGLAVGTHHVMLNENGYAEDSGEYLYGYHTWVVSAQNDD